MQQSQRLSQMLFVTLREDPVEAELPSHKLLLRGCFIRRLSPGIYTYLPLLWRVLQKISEIVRQEMNAIGGQECLLPQLQPAEIWRESGRWDVYTQAEGIMFALKDRQGREQSLGPTHEEVITLLARDLIRSYRQLPQTLYQIQTKFRDEIRPRFGLMRGREFIMKDAYSFHANEESLRQTYQDMYRAYSRILRRCGLEFRVVDADAGAIGGPSAASQEFMVLASAGEDEILYTPDGSYAANVEKAVSIPPPAAESPYTAFQVLDTPGTETIEKLAAFLKISSTLIVKNVLYQALYDNGLRVAVLLSIRGDQEVNEVKLANHLSRLAERYQASKLLKLALADAEIQNSWQGDPIPVGYIAPDLPDSCLGRQKNLAPQILRLADQTAALLQNFVTGGNQVGQHVVGANWGEQYPLPEVVDVRKAQAGDRCLLNPDQILETARGIEIGHIFQLGLKFSLPMRATFTDEQGSEQPLWMGCYGIGVSRLAQAAVEQSHDANGIIWPVAIAPYHVVVVVPNISDPEQMSVAEKLVQDLATAGIETLWDDRDERAGVKFKDADLIGIPYRITTGRSLKQGKVELTERASGQATEIPIEEVVTTLKERIEAALAVPD
ncbi:prolyl-tRNA synthetase [Synechococcus sp. JA-2-3B'a(2-13)]|uniref:Proline--tRNA ligase n=1 Tax=Synechococcus sp. (strain JA-2-3B'a(2-13)) TaxID=321332 RepID=SYP_SYNJB|nr:proline--tRNA ligase [Synechococcus sp. JA-2-3B'a(2-13)]Q2JMD8.1 RecName: Full=Proline--tRNA ligase; AltName: Full=Prolyl-tRNA synthetase; Short=ProRS [Synechococcus sp. JA-2-3B'a(2-13)]ABD02103.1 prolyl-tRNA synthetase [Synechococcus sp. JA-2-3B'a(2-13)]